MSLGEAQVSELVFVEELSNLDGTGTRRAIVDISSMSRKTMAGVMAGLLAYRGESVEVTFCYASAAFETPPSKYPAAVLLDTVSSVFGGAPRGPDKPAALVMGLGVERGRALAAYSQLEAQAAWALFPIGGDPRYERFISGANVDLLRMSSKITTIRYDINDPMFLYVKLRALIEGIRPDFRIVIVPSGAKLAALVSFLGSP
jgi:hypothetical protein